MVGLCGTNQILLIPFRICCHKWSSQEHGAIAKTTFPSPMCSVMPAKLAYVTGVKSLHTHISGLSDQLLVTCCSPVNWAIKLCLTSCFVSLAWNLSLSQSACWWSSYTLLTCVIMHLSVICCECLAARHRHKPVLQFVTMCVRKPTNNWISC